jgi:hypothetical protein
MRLDADSGGANRALFEPGLLVTKSRGEELGLLVLGVATLALPPPSCLVALEAVQVCSTFGGGYCLLSQ